SCDGGEPAASERSRLAAVWANVARVATTSWTAAGSSTSSSATSSRLRVALMTSLAAVCRCSMPARASSSRRSAAMLAPLEDDLQSAVPQAGIADRLGPQGVRERDRPPVGAHPHQQLVASPAELEVVPIGEGQLERERGAAPA